MFTESMDTIHAMQMRELQELLVKNIVLEQVTPIFNDVNKRIADIEARINKLEKQDKCEVSAKRNSDTNKENKPCPFCGSDDLYNGSKTIRPQPSGFFVVCGNCFTEGPLGETRKKHGKSGMKGVIMLSQKDVDTLLIGSIGSNFHRKCGFCGSEDTKPIHVVTIHDWAIICNSCKAQGPIAETENDAWVKWNLREDDYDKYIS